MSKVNQTQNSNPWTDYWSTNKTGNSFADANTGAGNYSDDVQRFWRAEIDKVSSGGVILDLATGNGALLSIAHEFSKVKQIDLTLFGVDKADVVILPSLKGKANVYGQTDMAKIPLESSSVDFITSQFGFEYSNMSASMLEVKRLLKPQASFTAICHHKHSALTKSSKELLSVYAQMEKRGFFKLCAPNLAHPDFGHFQNQLLAIMKPIVAQNANTDIQPDVMQIMKSLASRIQLAKTHPVTQVYRSISELSRGYFSHMQRLQQQLDASLNAQDIETLVREQSDNFTIDANETSFSVHDKVWVIKAKSL